MHKDVRRLDKEPELIVLVADRSRSFHTPIVDFLVFCKDFLQVIELPHDAVPASRSDDNRRTAGAVDFSAFRFHYEQTKSSGDGRPGGEAFLFIQCILWTLY